MIKTSKNTLTLMILFLIVVLISTFFTGSFLGKVRAATNITNTRINGNDRYETAAKISQAGWVNTSQYAIIATGEDFPDALCAAPLAKKYAAPILLTNNSNLNSYAEAELKRLNVTQVIIIGGIGVVSQNTENQLISLGINIKRIAGSNRYETSKKVAEEMGTNSKVVVATGEDFPDALSISSIAASNGFPILLTKTNSIPEEIKSYLSSNTFAVSYVIGGPGVINDSVLTGLQNPKRLYGNNRYDTNIAVLKEFYTSLNLSNVYIATGKDFPDALATSALTPITASPLILMGATPEASTKDYIKTNISLINNSTEIGGPSIIPDAILDIALNSHKPIYAIDIGHNANHDTGAVGIRSEDACTKEVGTLVIQKLTDLGYIAINCSPTNPTSTTDSLQQRCDIANSAHADYFMSIHFNIFNGAAKGSEVFMGSDKIKVKADQVLANLANLGFSNRGTYDNSRGLYVLSNTDMPAMLVECAFLDSVSDMARYDANKIADALVNGLLAGN